MGRPRASCEALIAITNDPDALDASEVRLLTGRALAAGLDQLIFHGMPTDADQPDGTPWFPFATGAEGQIFPAMTTWLRPGTELWEQLPELTTWMARLSYATRLGAPHADIAWLHPDQAFGDLTRLHFDGFEPFASEDPVSRAIMSSGLSYDRVSRAMLAGATVENGVLRVGEMTYAALLWPDVEAVSPELSEALLAWADAGLPIVRLGELPRRAMGWVDAEARDAAVAEDVAALGDRIPLAGVEDVGAVLRAAGVGVLTPPDGGTQLELLYRRVDGGWLVMALNEQKDEVAKSFVAPDAASVERWNPSTDVAGVSSPLEEGGRFTMRVPGRDARVYLLRDATP